MRKNVLRPLQLALLLAVTTLLGACQEAPESDIVVNKNDGTFDTTIAESVSGESNTFTSGAGSVTYENTVENTTGTIKIHINIHESDLHSGVAPVVQVTPHNIAASEAKKIAEALFGESNIFEGNFDPSMSAEIAEEKLLDWRQMANDSGLKDLYGSENYSSAKTIISETLDNMAAGSYSIAADSARKECTWEYHPDYYYMPENMAGGAANGNNTILALVDKGNTTYRYWVTNRDAQDYRIQSVYAYVSSEYSSPWDIETLHMIRNMCGYEKATEEEVAKIKEAAIDMINKMGIGEWTIVECSCDAYRYWQNNDAPAYVVNIAAVPLCNGTPLLHLPQLENLKSEDIYASNYYYTELKLSFSPSGELIEMSYTSPIDIISEINHNVEIIDFERTMELVEQYLRHKDVSSFDEAVGSMDGSQINIEINKLEFGLARVKMRGNVTDFYLVPAVYIKGDYQVMLDGNAIYTYSQMFNEDASFLVINLVDGSLINTDLGY